MDFQKQYWHRNKLNKRRHPSHNAIKEFVVPKIEKISEFIPIDKNTRLLDVGAGNGFFSYYFDQLCKTTAVDYSEKMIEMNPIHDKYVMNAESLELEDNSYDIVFSHALLHHVYDEEIIIKEMIRVSSKYIIIIEPNRNNPFMFLFSAIVPEERKALRFSLKYLRSLVKAKDLKIIASFSFGLIVPNKTPSFIVPFLKPFNKSFALGMYNFVITEK